MRKLVVVMLIVGSLLLLEAPALAPHLYKLDRIGTEVSGGKLKFTAETDCDGSVIVILTDDRLATAGPGALNPSTDTRKLSLRFVDKGPNERPGVRSAYCDTELMTLPFTGFSGLRTLALGLMLLVAGVVLVLLGRAPART